MKLVLSGSPCHLCQKVLYLFIWEALSCHKHVIRNHPTAPTAKSNDSNLTSSGCDRRRKTSMPRRSTGGIREITQAWGVLGFSSPFKNIHLAARSIIPNKKYTQYTPLPSVSLTVWLQITTLKIVILQPKSFWRLNYHILTQLWPFQCHGSRRLQKLSRKKTVGKKTVVTKWCSNFVLWCLNCNCNFFHHKRSLKTLPSFRDFWKRESWEKHSFTIPDQRSMYCNMLWNVSKMVWWTMYPPSHMSSHNKSKLAPCKGSNQKACPFFHKFKVSF